MSLNLNPNYILKTVAGKAVVMPVGDAVNDIRGMITLNESAELIWRALESGTDYDGILALLKKEYNAPADVLKADLDRFLGILKEKKILL